MIPLRILGIIPARYASTRFPAKALVDIGGISMIQRVYTQAKKSTLLSGVLVATDHHLIYDHVQSFGGNVVMTSEQHLSGTDRCNEAMSNHGSNYDFVINIQGDEPFIHPEQIDLLAKKLTAQTQIATLAKKIDSVEELTNINCPKVIFNQSHNAIYFSRHPIPYFRGKEISEWIANTDYFKHIGIYAYRTDVLAKIAKLKPGVFETAESLEQLRWIENGYEIEVWETVLETIGIDSPDDLQKVLLKQNLH